MIFAKLTAAPEPRTKNALYIAWFFAAILIIMAVGQLFSFEKFIPLIEQYHLPGGYGTAVLVAGIVVVSEVFALPHLLRMKLSPLMRVVSMVCSWVAAAVWVKLTILANLLPNELTNIGLLGTAVKLPVGWWAVLVTFALLILAGWSMWGLWPKSLKK